MFNAAMLSTSQIASSALFRCGPSDIHSVLHVKAEHLSFLGCKPCVCSVLLLFSGSVNKMVKVLPFNMSNTFKMNMLCLLQLW